MVKLSCPAKARPVDGPTLDGHLPGLSTDHSCSIFKGNLSFLYLLLLIGLIQCPAGPPTGPDFDLSKKLTLDCIIQPDSNTQKIFLSKWYKCPEYPSPLSECSNIKDIENITVTGAEVKIYVNGNELPSEEVSIDLPWQNSYYYTSYYNVTTPKVLPGQNWEIEVSHQDFEEVYTKTTIPDSVVFNKLLPDTLLLEENTLTFQWSQANGASGYLPQLYLVVNDTIYWGLFTYFNFEEMGGEESTPSSSRIIQFPIDNLLQQVDYYFSSDSKRMSVLEDDINLSLQLEVYSMNEALYNVLRYDYRPDEISGFNAPIQIFSNVENGGGILGAFWCTYSKKIIINREFLLDFIKNS